MMRSQPARSVASAAARGFFHPSYHVDLPAKHRFPMERYRAVHRLLRRLQEAEAAPIRLALSPRATALELTRAHCPEYVNAFVQGRLSEAHQREIGFPWSPDFVERTLRITGGTLEAARLAVQAAAHDRSQPTGADSRHDVIGWGVEANQAGGTHHAFADRGEGFCVFNDAAVVARAALTGTLFACSGVGTQGAGSSLSEEQDRSAGSSHRSAGSGGAGGRPRSPSDATSCSDWQPNAPADRSPRPGLPVRVRLVYIVDLDVHQGNGTAAILGSDADARALTLSVHAERNYPWRTRSPSDIDIGLADDVTDEGYLAAVQKGLTALEERGQAVAATLAEERKDRDRGCSRGSELQSEAREDHPAEPDPSSPAQPGQQPLCTRPDGGLACDSTPRGSTVEPEALLSAGGDPLAPPPEVDLVLFQAGVDPLRSDRLGRLGLSRTALHKRNEIVFEWCFQRGLPVVVMMGGGYSRPIEHSVRAHADVFMQAGQLAKRRQAVGAGWSLLAPEPLA